VRHGDAADGEGVGEGRSEDIMIATTNVRIYLDTCVYNRPFDDQAQPCIWLETLAFSIILQMIEDQAATLITSTVVGYESNLHPDPVTHAWVMRCSALAQENQFVDALIRQGAEALAQEGFKALDALNIACAEAATCDYFITCDDRLLRRYKRKKVRYALARQPSLWSWYLGGEG